MHNLHTAKQQLFERLDKMVEGKADESEVSFLIDSLRVRSLLEFIINIHSYDLVHLERRELM